MIAALAKEKDKSVSKLSYMDPPMAPKPEPRQQHVKSGPAKLVILQRRCRSRRQGRVGGNQCISTALALAISSFLADDAVAWAMFPHEAQGSSHGVGERDWEED